MQIKGTHHIALKTANFAAMQRFYIEVLGLPYVGGFPGRNIIFLDLGDTSIELIEDQNAWSAPVQGWHHLALEVEDTDAAYAELLAQQVAFHIPPKNFPEDKPLVRLAFFKDPDGNELELFQPIGSRYPQ